MTKTGGLLRRHRGFRSLWAADALSQLGDRINFLALPLLAATTLQASAFEVSLLRILQTLAYLLLGLQVGAWCDRTRNRPILIVADLGRAVAYGTVPVAAAFGVLTLWQLYVVVAVAGVLGVFFEVAHQTFLPRLVDHEDLTEANARLQTNLSVAAVAGPSASGFLVEYFGAPAARGERGQLPVVGGMAQWRPDIGNPSSALNPGTDAARDRRRPQVRDSAPDPARLRREHGAGQPVPVRADRGGRAVPAT